MARSRRFPRFHDTGGPSSPRSRPRFFQQNWAFFRIFFDQKSLVILATDGSLEAITPGEPGFEPGRSKSLKTYSPYDMAMENGCGIIPIIDMLIEKIWMTMINVENHDLP